jgi:hypothetical protein
VDTKRVQTGTIVNDKVNGESRLRLRFGIFGLMAYQEKCPPRESAGKKLYARVRTQSWRIGTKQVVDKSAETFWIVTEFRECMQDTVMNET